MEFRLQSVVTCPNCGQRNGAEATFCSKCGTKLDAASSAPREIRKTVTVVFCDVTGSTALGERLDPETLRGVMSRYFERMKSVLESHGGTVEKFIGDAVMAVFGIPVLHEDDALRAVRAANDMRTALGQLNDEFERELSVSLAVRIGVNTGSVVAGDAASGQNLVTGDAVNVAARLEEAAAPGEIFIGSSTFDLTRDAVDVESVNPLVLKGKADVVDAYLLLSVRSGAAGHQRRLESPMVGRGRPLQVLREAFDTASDDTSCRLMTVIGSAGIGKSRLVREFVTAVAERATVLPGRCLSYGEGITFWPIAQMATVAAGISENDPSDRAREALRRALTGAPEGDVVAAHLAVMMGLDDGPLEAPWAVRRFLEALARRRPLVAVFDDIQWAEPTLLDVIEHVADWSHDAPILLLCVARSEFMEVRPGWGTGNGNATSIILEPLSEPEADELIGNLLGNPALTPEIRERIRGSAQGNPLFVEEMLSMLLDDGVLVQKEGEWVTTVDLTTVQVPPAISALLAARLDRLSDVERTVLEAASVVGEVFERSALRALVPEARRSDIDQVLSALLRKDVIRPSPSDVGEDLACRFRHILFRDAAYEAVPKAERASLHEAFAKHLVTTVGQRAAEFDEFVGYHFERAHVLRTELGQHDERSTALARSAFEHLAAAGHRAFDRGDTGAAASLLARASDLLNPDDTDRRGIAWQLGTALIWNGDVEKARDVLEDASSRARDAGDEVSAGYAEAVLWDAALTGPDVDVDAWETSANRLIALFEDRGDHRGAALAWFQKGEAHWFRNRFEDTAAASERALEHAMRAGDRRLENDARESVIAGMTAGPRPLREGLAITRRTLEDARSNGDRGLEASALRRMSETVLLMGQIDEARVLCAESRQMMRELGNVIAFWTMATSTAWVERLAGNVDAAAVDLRESCDQLESLGQLAYLSSNAGMLAQIELERGDVSAAERWIAVAEGAASPHDSDAQTRLAYVRGLLAAQRGDAEAEQHLRAALTLLDATDSPVGRAQIRLALSRLLGLNRRAEALALAREALDLLEAKGATVYLPAARELLAELADGA